ncbi:MAG: glycosyltransferase family 2 protein, partial [Tepidisphaeraceae bacterium]
LPTCNRASLLEKAITAIEAGTRCAHEIIVVDGASADGTRDVLASASKALGERLRIIREDQREGFVKAANKGFRAATGRNLTWLNDDARPLPGSLDSAVQQLDAEDEHVAFVAMFHRWNSTRNIAYETSLRGRVYRLCHVRGTLYANFPMGRRQTFQALGLFDEQYFVRGADPDLSLKAWNMGMRVTPAWDAMIDHDELHDERHMTDEPMADQDNARLFAKWDLPPRNPLRNDFDPERPCTLRGLRDTLAIAA